MKRTIWLYVCVWLLQKGNTNKNNHDHDDERRRRRRRRKPDGTGVDLFVRSERNYSSRRFNSGTAIYIVLHKSNAMGRHEKIKIK